METIAKIAKIAPKAPAAPKAAPMTYQPVTKLVFSAPAVPHAPIWGDPVCDACEAVYQRGWCGDKCPGARCPAPTRQ